MKGQIVSESSQKRAILQVTRDPEEIDHFVGVAQRLQTRFPGLQVGIVVSGEALSGTIGTTPIDTLDGVCVAACAYGLDKHGYETWQLRPGIGIVPTAISAIVEAQLDGAAYVRI